MAARNPDYLTPPPPANSPKDSAGQARPQRKPWSKPTLRSADSLMYVSSNPTDGKTRTNHEGISHSYTYQNPS